MSENDFKRPQIQYILYFHKMFQTLNAFTARVDELFERMLTIPYITAKDCSTALKYLQDKIKVRGVTVE